jgi:hypothetical protein
MIPFAGWGATGGKLGRRVMHMADDGANIAGGAAKHADEVIKGIEKANEGVKLTGSGRKRIGAMIDIKDMDAINAIRKRGGGGSQINQLSTRMRNKTVGEIANLAAIGDEEAEVALKIIKDAKRLAEKYGGKGR